jgi:hypothetical protein
VSTEEALTYALALRTGNAADQTEREAYQAEVIQMLARVGEAAQKTVNTYEAYGFGHEVEHRVRLLRATLERP